MERTRTSIISNIIDFIQAFRVSESGDNGRVAPEDLNKAEREELRAIIGNHRGKKQDKKDPFIEKYGPAKPGNPIYDTARKMSEHEEEIKGERQGR